ncbi:Pet8p [Malassezia vespertilionis]|uniref:Pet8p n=1 Tax=Malassezia vespertilionis TaxID=2020962 RepID=A0A2N1JG81_9BASI|nr:Pet8p [Malassezia vespertilionis]
MEVGEVGAAGLFAPRFSTALMAGAVSGMSVDFLFYPIDTLKTRMQSAQGFWKAGGFAGVYRGMGSVAVGSAPGASIFFTTYESMKSFLSKNWYGDRPANSAVVHMLSASIAEVSACMVRVPTEVVKSRQQTSVYGRISSVTAFRNVVAGEGVAGLYRGFSGTILREIPFTCIQFPLYEYFKHTMTTPGKRSTWWQAAGAGSIAGSIAAALTTPLDVIKTRIMLAKMGTSAAEVDTRICTTLRGIVHQGGLGALFAGIVPRTLWIGLGGAVFLGTFDITVKAIQTVPA